MTVDDWLIANMTEAGYMAKVKERANAYAVNAVNDAAGLPASCRDEVSRAFAFGYAAALVDCAKATAKGSRK